MNQALADTHQFNAQKLIGLGEQAELIVTRVKDFAHPLEQDASEARFVSLREIGELLNVSHTAVQKAVAGIRDRLNGETKPGRTYQFSLADSIAIREEMGRMRRRAPGEPCVTLGVMNFKGGVAKSTTTAHLAQNLALHGYRTLAIDCDPQGTLSTLFGIHPDLELTADDTLVPYFEGTQKSLHYCIKKHADIPTLSVIPANVGLAQADLILPGRQQSQQHTGWYYFSALAEGIRTIEQDFDIILLDCPPSMSYLTTVAIQACDNLLLPMRPSMPDFASSAQFIRMFSSFQANVDAILGYEKTFDWIRVLITLGEKNNTSIEMEDIIRAAYGEVVLPQKFPYLTAVATAAKRMRTIYDVNRADIPSRQLVAAQMLVDQMCSSIEDLVLRTRAKRAAQAGKESGRAAVTGEAA